MFCFDCASAWDKRAGRCAFCRSSTGTQPAEEDRRPSFIARTYNSMFGGLDLLQLPVERSITGLREMIYPDPYLEVQAPAQRRSRRSRRRARQIN